MAKVKVRLLYPTAFPAVEAEAGDVVEMDLNEDELAQFIASGHLEAVKTAAKKTAAK